MSFLVAGIIVVFLFWFVRATAAITYFGLGTDNQKQMSAAASASQWRWPSDMHKFAGDKSWMKDSVVLCFALAQNLLKDKFSDRVTVATFSAAHAVASFFIFEISRNYWGEVPALIVFGLYFFSAWAWQLTMLSGSIQVGIMFFTVSVWCLQQAQAGWGWPGYVLSGVFFGLMQFSSASSRKLAPLYLAALLASQAQFLGFQLSGTRFVSAAANPAALGFLLLALATWTGLRLYAGPIVGKMYASQAHPLLNQLIERQEQYPLEHYAAKFDRSIKVFIALFFGLFFYVTAVWYFYGPGSLYGAHVPVGLGILGICLFLLAPNIPFNLKGYMRYYNIAKLYNHYKLYSEHFARQGHPIPEDFRGKGLLWLWRFFCRVNPVLLSVNIGCILMFVLWAFSGRLNNSQMAEAVFVLVSALSPVIFAELTGCLQLGRAYFPALLGQAAIVGYTVHTGLSLGLPFNSGVVWVLLGSHIAWNAWIWLSDIFPGRMATAWLVRDLKKHGVKELVTYDTAFNEVYAASIYEKDRSLFSVRFVRSLKELRGIDPAPEAVFVVPGVSSKTLHMETQPQGIANQDFDSDTDLDHLLGSGDIDRLAFLKYKTVGTSRMWSHESDPLSFRDLILREVTDQDRWRAHLWVIQARQIKEYFNGNK